MANRNFFTARFRQYIVEVVRSAVSQRERGRRPSIDACAYLDATMGFHSAVCAALFDQRWRLADVAVAVRTCMFVSTTQHVLGVYSRTEATQQRRTARSNVKNRAGEYQT